MPLKPYRRILALPRVRNMMLLMLVARLPMTAMGITLTLYVVSDLGRGYGEAGLVGTATTLGTAAGAPIIGRMIDKYGLRPILVVCGTASTVYWISIPYLPYPVLVIAALPAGMLAIPAGSIARQVLTALVPAQQRRTAFALDTIAVELSFMIGPAVGTLSLTQFGSVPTMSGIGASFAIIGFALYRANPPVRTTAETSACAVRTPIRHWLTAPLIAALLIAVGALIVLVGMELSMLAALRASGDVDLTGVLFIVVCLASAAGGIVHGAMRRSLGQLPLMVLLAGLLLPVALLDKPWWLLALALIPMNLACAPTIAATTETVSRLAPASARGEAMGLQDSATKIGLALGSPVVGFAIDHSSPSWGFVTGGLGGLCFAGIALLLRGRKSNTKRAGEHPVTVGSV